MAELKIIRDPYSSYFNKPGTANGTLGLMQMPTMGTPKTVNFTKNVADYGFGSTPNVGTDPLAGQQRMTFDAPQVSAPGYALPTGEMYSIGADIGQMDATQDYGMMGLADSNAALLQRWADAAIESTREQEIARGMGRSGVALEAERRTGLDTEMQRENIYSTATAEQGRLNATAAQQNAQLALAREQSNQQASQAWSEFTDSANRYQAALQQSTDLANQAAQIEMSGQAAQYQVQLADLQARREMANQAAELEMKNMRSSYNQFQQGLDLERQVQANNANLGWAQQSTNQYSAMADAMLGQGSLSQQRYATDLQYGVNQPGGGAGGMQDIYDEIAGYYGQRQSGDTAMEPFNANRLIREGLGNRLTPEQSAYLDSRLPPNPGSLIQSSGGQYSLPSFR